MIVSLNTRERDLFASWLEQEAETGKRFIEQYKKLSSTVSQILIQREEIAISAALVVAKKLRSVEEM